MTFNLHERLSEFSYGYGVTRETERALRSMGLKTTPYLPSLVTEKKIGADVVFKRPGTLLMLQFKLGEELLRYRKKGAVPAPKTLARPFWRFWVNTADIDGQFAKLRNAEDGNAEVYYVAPRFAAWDAYASAFERGKVLENSLLILPSQIEHDLRRKSAPDGWHAIIYDLHSVYVCSDPGRVEQVRAQELAARVRGRIERDRVPLIEALRNLYGSLGRVRDIRRDPREEGIERRPNPTPSARVATEQRRAEEREARFFRLLIDLRSDEESFFATVGLEMWATGAQMIAVTLDN